MNAVFFGKIINSATSGRTGVATQGMVNFKCEMNTKYYCIRYESAVNSHQRICWLVGYRHEKVIGKI